jgi:hypothetical protein
LDRISFDNFKKHYGKYSSWLIYEQDCRDYGCIERRINEINPKYIFCALNAARPTEHYWQPFHIVYKGGRAWVLRDVLGGSPVFGGSYITDLIKGHPTKTASELMKEINGNIFKLDQHINTFIREVEDLRSDGKMPTIIVLGIDARILFQTQNKLAIFKDHLEYITHYSARGKHLKQFIGEIKSLEQKYSL